MKYRDIQLLFLLFSGIVAGHSCADYPGYKW